MVEVEVRIEVRMDVLLLDSLDKVDGVSQVEQVHSWSS
tara:strand:- start:298 stop:411 length:114 start_codon:yes stop_codon:yes gene_type:complete